jgi:predicted nucleic acid-binding protein
MSAAVLLDTSFLISLVNAQRPNHPAAVQYYRHMLQTQMPMYFSAIVAAEFGIKQPIVELPLSNFRTLNFNVPHGLHAAQLWNALGQREAGDARAVVRDDVKLIAQAAHESIGFILTEDASSLHRYCERLRNAGLIQTRAITLADGFHAQSLREDGQLDWVDDVTEEAD